jgi:hypothetical protein
MVVGDVAGDIGELEGDAEIGGAGQRRLVLCGNPHDHRHHAAHRSRDVIAIADEVGTVVGAPALAIEPEALEMVVKVGWGNGALAQQAGQAVEWRPEPALVAQCGGRAPPQLVDSSLVRGGGGGRGSGAQILTVANVVAMSAPGVEQPGAFARLPIEQAAGHPEGFGAGADGPFRIGDEALARRCGGNHPSRCAIISPAVALALPTTPGIPAPGWVPAPTK